MINYIILYNLNFISIYNIPSTLKYTFPLVPPIPPLQLKSVLQFPPLPTRYQLQTTYLCLLRLLILYLYSLHCPSHLLHVFWTLLVCVFLLHFPHLLFVGGAERLRNQVDGDVRGNSDSLVVDLFFEFIDLLNKGLFFLGVLEKVFFEVGRFEHFLFEI